MEVFEEVERWGAMCRSARSQEVHTQQRDEVCFTLSRVVLLFPLFLLRTSGLLPLMRSFIYSPVAILEETKAH